MRRRKPAPGQSHRDHDHVEQQGRSEYRGFLVICRGQSGSANGSMFIYRAYIWESSGEWEKAGGFITGPPCGAITSSSLFWDSLVNCSILSNSDRSFSMSAGESGITLTLKGRLLLLIRIAVWSWCVAATYGADRTSFLVAAYSELTSTSGLTVTMSSLVLWLR